MEPLEAGAYAASSHTGTSVSTHAGFPNPATERSGAALSLDKLLVRHPSSTYFFRIRGHSWHEQGVFDGDIAVIDRALTPHGSDLVIWWQESGEFALSPYSQAAERPIWGTITATVHSFGDRP